MRRPCRSILQFDLPACDGAHRRYRNRVVDAAGRQESDRYRQRRKASASNHNDASLERGARRLLDDDVRSWGTSGTPTAWAMGLELPRLAPSASTFTVKVNGVEMATFPVRSRGRISWLAGKERAAVARREGDVVLIERLRRPSDIEDGRDCDIGRLVHPRGERELVFGGTASRRHHSGSARRYINKTAEGHWNWRDCDRSLVVARSIERRDGDWLPGVGKPWNGRHDHLELGVVGPGWNALIWTLPKKIRCAPIENSKLRPRIVEGIADLNWSWRQEAGDGHARLGGAVSDLAVDIFKGIENAVPLRGSDHVGQDSPVEIALS